MTVLIGVLLRPDAPGRTKPRPLRPALVGLLRSLRRFYARPSQYRTLIVASLLLSYGGGAVMFWFHGIYRGEQGPAISPWAHWLLDSTLGLAGLTPAIALLLPLADWVCTRGWSSPRPSRLALLVGPSFALVTAPGPVVHNLLVGRGTILANLATNLISADSTTSQALAVQHSAVMECLLQVLVGLPVYTLLTFATLTAIAHNNHRTATARPPKAGHVHVLHAERPPQALLG